MVENHHKQKWLKVIMKSTLKLVQCTNNDNNQTYFNDEYRLQCNSNKNHLVFDTSDHQSDYQPSTIFNDNIDDQKQINSLITSRQSVNTEDLIPPGHW